MSSGTKRLQACVAGDLRFPKRRASQPLADGNYVQRPEEGDEWQKTMQKVIKTVVSIHFACVTPFDTEAACVSEATGFVVDAARGIIMTNRHVVGPGPFCGFAVFNNHEECPVKPVYRDPVHDFGFLQFDPTNIRHAPVKELRLRPEMAKIGREIRIVGNDAGEKLSILSGFISRLDRNAPEYGDMTYNDFNTEYIQAAASTSGGSSGSPVVDIDGNVLALQAGGSVHASTDFFLPLYRGKRALDCLRLGRDITRGTIQVQWLLKPFDECVRLGLHPEEEKEARKAFPESTGLLVAETILPEGPGSHKIEEGDVLVSINDVRIAEFRHVEELLDTSIGESIKIVVQRNGMSVTEHVNVMDLHSITPDRYVEVAGAVFHNLSYQIARLYSIPVKGVYIAETGQVFRPDRETTGWLLVELNNQVINDIDDFIRVVQEIPDRKRVAAKFKHVTDMHTVKTSIIEMDRHWHKDITLAVRDDKQGTWTFTQLGDPKPPFIPTRQSAKFAGLYIGEEAEACSELAKSFVKVEASVPMAIEGYANPAAEEYGIVVDSTDGYVLVSRYCVPHYLCDVSVTVAESITVPAKVVFLHPQQNYAIVQYDPSLVDAPIKEVRFGTKRLTQGTKAVFVGYNHNYRSLVAQVRVTDVTTVSIPQGPEVSPRYRATNLDSPAVDSPMLGDCNSGVLADFDGTVRGIWSTYMGDVTSNGRDRKFRLALDAVDIAPVVELLKKNGSSPDPRFVDLELAGIQLVNARVRGVSEHWLMAVQQQPHSRHQLFSVLRVSSNLAGVIEEGDVIVAINGRLITHLSQLMNLEQENVDLTIVRSGQEQVVSVPTTSTSSLVTDEIVSWCGIVVHKPHHAVLQQIKTPPSLVYVAHVAAGSPGNQYGISSTHFITHVNGIPTPTIPDFYAAITKIPDSVYVKLRVVTFDGIPCACSIRTNYHYFKTWRRVLADSEWDMEKASIEAVAA